MKDKKQHIATGRSAGRNAGTPKTVSKDNASAKAPGKGNVGNTGKPLWRRLPVLPIPIMVFLLVWWWAAYWQGDVFRMARENSFFAPDSLLMEYELSKTYGMIRCVGRALLTLFRYPWLGGMVLSIMLTLSCWLLGYAMKLTPRWRWIQWLPLAIYTGIFTYNGLNNYFEAETGYIMGIPLCILVILMVWGVIIRSFSKKHSPALFSLPKDETPMQNILQLATALIIGVVPAMIYGSIERPYVRPIAHMQVAVMEQDWDEVIETAHQNAELSYRPMAAQYAIALVQKDMIAEGLFDIRLDYDSLFITGINEANHDALNLYQMECDYHAGLTQTAYHHAMESMAMEGPTLRNLKMLCKTAILRNEWNLAEKYLTILDRVPFEGAFTEKYRAMLHDEQAVANDPEFAVIKETEPMHDLFENNLIQPVFLGYNAALPPSEARSKKALYNSLITNIYTKTMDDFLYRCQGLDAQGTPTSIAQALALLSGKHPEIREYFTATTYLLPELQSFLESTQEYINPRAGITEEEKEGLLALGMTPSGGDTLTSAENRALHARELFTDYKGFYPYYYFFGNLKATKKKDKKGESSNAGVN